jgi:hypothetical protein
MPESVYLFQYRPIDQYDEYPYIFSTLEKAQVFAVWFLGVSWDEDLAEYLAEEELPEPTSVAETLAHYETIINQGLSSAYFSIEETELDPVGRAEIHPFVPQAPYA